MYWLIDWLIDEKPQLISNCFDQWYLFLCGWKCTFDCSEQINQFVHVTFGFCEIVIAIFVIMTKLFL